MKTTDILKNIDEDATSVKFEARCLACDCFGIKVFANLGADFILPDQYTTEREAKQMAKYLNFAYKLGQQMQARRTINQQISKS